MGSKRTELVREIEGHYELSSSEQAFFDSLLSVV